jgi:hypothetical protein
VSSTVFSLRGMIERHTLVVSADPVSAEQRLTS